MREPNQHPSIVSATLQWVVSSILWELTWRDADHKQVGEAVLDKSKADLITLIQVHEHNHEYLRSIRMLPCKG